MASITIVSASPEQTGQIAAVLARHLRPGDVVLLNGGLATGKTTFIQAVTRTLGSADPVTSPTFTLVHFYATAAAPVMHIDAYRLSGVHEYRDLGLDDYAEESVTLIEWGDIVAADFPCHLRIELAHRQAATSDRLLSFGSDCASWLPRLSTFQAELAGGAAAGRSAAP